MENQTINVFNVGDLAVYPGHGVGEIKAIEQREVCEEVQNFYIMVILDSNITIMIPKNNTTNVGLRQLVNKDEIKEVYITLKRRRVKLSHQTWNKRYKQFHEKIKRGSLFEVAEVFRDLNLISINKELSFGERKMMETAKHLIVSELALARALQESDVEKEIQDLFTDQQTEA
ncbi:MAG: CarD family transcriptional regulator [Deltaproteobacteria bacterium]|nr:MAG: CarD family transcriptional regulator [Deltaproteobacteria bacterium]